MGEKMNSTNRLFELRNATVVGQVNLVGIHTTITCKQKPAVVNKEIRLFKKQVRYIQKLIKKLISSDVYIPEKYQFDVLSNITMLARRNRTHCGIGHQKIIVDNIIKKGIESTLKELSNDYSFLLSDAEEIQKKYNLDKDSVEVNLLHIDEMWNNLLSYVKILYIIFDYIEKDTGKCLTQHCEDSGIWLDTAHIKQTGLSHLKIVK